MRPRRICLVSHFAYGAMTGGNSGHIGGVERQTSLMARWLASRGHDVSLITWDEGQAEAIRVDGVTIHKLCRKNDGLIGIRFFHPRWTSLCAAMTRADADVYYQNCGEYVTGQVALWCKRKGKKFVYSIAADNDCRKELPDMKTIRERILYRFGLKNADRVIVQTDSQKRLLLQGFDILPEIIPMPCPGPSEAEYDDRRFPVDTDIRVLWIGRLCKVKRPEMLLELASRCPDIHFDFVGPANGDAFSNNVLSIARSLQNLKVHGAVSRDRVPELYKNAFCLCCTSEFEGFPNTFLEAWSHGLPVVSTFDPDGMITEKGLGLVSNDIDGLTRSLRILIDSPETWLNASQRGRAYFQENHAFEPAMRRFEEALCRS